MPLAMQPDGTPAVVAGPAGAAPYQTVLLVPQNQPVLFVNPGSHPGSHPVMAGPHSGVMPFHVQQVSMMPPAPMMSGMPTPIAEPIPQQPSAAASDATPEPEQPAQSKSNGRSKNRGYFKSDSGLSKMSGDQKAALAKYIFDFMVKKGFTSPEGYLIVDVFSEVWKEMGDSAEGWRVAQHRFGHLLRSSPQYFRLFRRGIRVANQCGWFARKGEKMVRLVLDKEK
jgi:hypothetical protein